MLQSYGENSEFEAAIKKLASRSKSAVQNQKDESRTIHSIILPLIDALGYDTYNDEEVVPEFSADVGIKHGEKVDYALKIDGKPIILIEVKSATTHLRTTHQSQLFRYFTTTEVRIAILTNGIEAWFYSDLDRPNVMDDTPFFKYNFQEPKDTDIDFLKQLCKNNFSVRDIIAQAHTLKNADKIKDYIQSDILNPNDDFVQLIAKGIMGRRLRRNEVENFQASVKSAFAELTQKNKAEAQPATLPPIDNSRPISNQTNKPQSQLRKRKHHTDFLNNEVTKRLYSQYKGAILGIGNDVNESDRMQHNFLFCKGETDFVSIILKRSGMKLGFNLGRIENLRGLDKNVGSYRNEDGEMRGRLGIGDFFINVDENSDHDYVIRQLKCIYDNIN